MQEGSTALHQAADSGFSSAVKALLLEGKAQVDACNEVFLKKQLFVVSKCVSLAGRSLSMHVL
jgi:hypothetical protein